jgi:hypothetical protein
MAGAQVSMRQALRRAGLAAPLGADGGASSAISGRKTVTLYVNEAERDRIRERIGQVKADQKARGRYLGGIVPFGFRRGESGELIPHEIEQDAI